MLIVFQFNSIEELFLTASASCFKDIWPAIIDLITEPTDLKSLMVAGPVFSELIGSRRLPELVSNLLFHQKLFSKRLDWKWGLVNYIFSALFNVF